MAVNNKLRDDFLGMHFMRHQAAIVEAERIARCVANPQKSGSAAFKKYVMFHKDSFALHCNSEKRYIYDVVLDILKSRPNEKMLGEVQAMIEQHKTLFALYDELLQQLESGTDSTSLARQYADTVRMHITQEDTVLTEMVDEFLTDEELKSIIAGTRNQLGPDKLKLIGASLFTSLSEEEQVRLRKMVPRPFLIIAKLMVGDIRKIVAELDA